MCRVNELGGEVRQIIAVNIKRIFIFICYAIHRPYLSHAWWHGSLMAVARATRMAHINVLLCISPGEVDVMASFTEIVWASHTSMPVCHAKSARITYITISEVFDSVQIGRHLHHCRGSSTKNGICLYWWAIWLRASLGGGICRNACGVRSAMWESWTLTDAQVETPCGMKTKNGGATSMALLVSSFTGTKT